MEQIEFTILMPCLNEEKTIVSCIEEAFAYIKEKNLSAEVLIADNGSTDTSAELAKQAGARVVTIAEKGYGNALRGGLQQAKGKYVIMGDCDGSYPFSELDDFVEKLRDGYPLVMGDRFAVRMEPGAMSFSHRYVGVPILSALGRWRFHTDVRDFHCGLRGFDRRKAMELNFQCGGMEFATEMIAEFAKAGYPIAQVTVRLRRDGRNGRSHLRSIRDGWRHLSYILFECKSSVKQTISINFGEKPEKERKGE